GDCRRSLRNQRGHVRVQAPPAAACASRAPVSTEQLVEAADFRSETRAVIWESKPSAAAPASPPQSNAITRSSVPERLLVQTENPCNTGPLIPAHPSPVRGAVARSTRAGNRRLPHPQAYRRARRYAAPAHTA